MKAATHTEIYRPFAGRPAPARPRFVPLYRACVRQHLKRKLPLLVLFVPPWISAIVFSFVVYTKFTLEAGLESPLGGASLGAAMGTRLVEQLIQVHEQIVIFAHVSSLFALLALAWYGAGQICDDRRAGAHLLYFSRPLTRLDYFLAHYATACTFGAAVVLAPVLLICLVAVVSSPEYSFFTEKWTVIVGALGYACVDVAVLSSVVLAISSVSARKTYALAGVFVAIVGLEALGGALSALQRDTDFAIVGLLSNLRRLANWMLDSQRGSFDWDPWWSVAVLGGVALSCALVIAWRLRRMEIVG